MFKGIMKNHISLNKETRAPVSSLTRGTDSRHTDHTGPARLGQPGQPGQPAHEAVLQGTVGLRVMLASEV